jgi:phosphoglycolate phosphatase
LKLIVFDLDGTLIDSRRSILGSIDFALTQVGLEHFEIDPERAVQQDLASTIKQSAARGGYGISEDLIRRFISEYREHHAREPEATMKPFPFVPEVLKALKSSYALAVATTKHTEQAQHILQKLELIQFFDAVQGTDPGMRYKPAPDILLAVLRRLNFSATDALYIGDTVHDMTAAKAAGMRAVAVSFGYSRKEDLLTAEPHGWIHDLVELKTPERLFA